MKTVVVTGSTRGIGRGLAENFLARGCRVVISARKSEAVDAAVAELAQRFGADRVAGKACDIGQYDQVQALWNHAVSSFGVVDIWVNNAGISLARKPFHEQSPEDLRAIVETNLLGMMYCDKVAMQGMLAQGHGQIWNMEGFGSDGRTQAGMMPYGSTKAAVRYLNKGLNKDLEGTPVQINTLSPGIVVTELLTGDYDLQSAQWQKTKKVLNILGDRVETVTPYLVDGVLAATKPGTTVAWLTNGKAFKRFLGALFNKREDLFAEAEAAARQSTTH